jgi:uncharacterized protein YbcV (DUF1398 family)
MTQASADSLASMQKSQETTVNDRQAATANACLAAAYEGTMTFPAIVASLMAAGFEGYTVDYRRGACTYYLRDGDSVDLPLPSDDATVAAAFDAETVKAAIREAQSGSAGYTYKGFCRKVKAAGCAGYIVSFPGRRVVYFARTAETHVEHFPSD